MYYTSSLIPLILSRQHVNTYRDSRYKKILLDLGYKKECKDINYLNHNNLPI